MVGKLILVVGFVLGGAQSKEAVPVAEKAELCKVTGSGHTFFGHYLEVSGTVVGGSIDHLALSSSQCGGSIPLGFSKDVLGHEDVKTLVSALKRGRVSGDFEGGLIFTEQGAILRLQVDRVDALRFAKN
jgi:hypothetical protein